MYNTITCLIGSNNNNTFIPTCQSKCTKLLLLIYDFILRLIYRCLLFCNCDIYKDIQISNNNEGASLNTIFVHRQMSITNHKVWFLFSVESSISGVSHFDKQHNSIKQGMSSMVHSCHNYLPLLTTHFGLLCLCNYTVKLSRSNYYDTGK